MQSGGPHIGSEQQFGPDRNMHNVLTLYVGNLASRVDEQALMGTFSMFGPITNIQVAIVVLLAFSTCIRPQHQKIWPR